MSGTCFNLCGVRLTCSTLLLVCSLFLISWYQRRQLNPKYKFSVSLWETPDLSTKKKLWFFLPEQLKPVRVCKSFWLAHDLYRWWGSRKRTVIVGTCDYSDASAAVKQERLEWERLADCSHLDGFYHMLCFHLAHLIIRLTKYETMCLTVIIQQLRNNKHFNVWDDYI